MEKIQIWWLTVSLLLVLILFLWIMIIFYLLSPHVQQMTNRQVLAVDEQGKPHLLLLLTAGQQNEVQQSTKRPRFLRKQEYVYIYDLRLKQWLTDPEKPMSLIPSFKSVNAFYLLYFCPKKKKFCQTHYDQDHLQVTNHFYTPSFYFLHELAVYMGLYTRKDSLHHRVEAM